MRLDFHNIISRPLRTIGIMIAYTAISTLGIPSGAIADENDVLSGVVLPEMDAERGKMLFAQRGCVVCHSVNNVGGTSGPSLDSSNMNIPREPFEFFARMWRGADAMLHLQQADLGYQIDFSGQDIADIFAFVQNAETQERFTQSDLPAHINEIIDNDPSFPAN